jgi:FMN phosphatase YigB (HAD superfamily)
MIKTVIFDLGRVIVPFDFNRGYERMSRLCGYPAAEIPERLRQTDLVNRFESGLVEPEAFVRELSSTLKMTVEYDDFCDIWSSIFSPETLIPESLIEAIHKRYRLLLLSNTNAIHFEMIRRSYPLLKHFDHFVLSYQVGAMKPSARIFEEAIRHAQCNADECFFTDDIPAYVEAAREQGLHAVVFQNREQLEQDLQQAGVKWDG